jgi:hypothetical protein
VEIFAGEHVVLLELIDNFLFFRGIASGQVFLRGSFLLRRRRFRELRWTCGGSICIVNVEMISQSVLRALEMIQEVFVALEVSMKPIV